MHKIAELVVVGLATDFCVRATAIDARKFGFGVQLVSDGVRAVYQENAEKVFAELERWGCKVVPLSEVKLEVEA